MLMDHLLEEPVLDGPQALAQCTCGHPMDVHDAIAARYCRATLAGALPRGCICVSVPEPSAH
jgi:hypothetical protein